MCISLVKIRRIKENMIKPNNCFGFSNLSRKAGMAARLHTLTWVGILLLFPCSSLLFSLGNQRKGVTCAPENRGGCTGFLGLDWVLGMAAASQVRSCKCCIPGGDELEKAAKGLLRFICEGIPFLSPHPIPIFLGRNPGGTLKVKPKCVFA